MERSELKRIAWHPIEPLDESLRANNGSIASLDALRRAWRDHLDSMSEEDRVRTRQRSLRRLSVETGLIERLYDIEWGMTLTLVAEGFTRDVVERAGGRVDESVLATLRAQRDSLEMVLDFVQGGRRLSVSFIRELHAALTRTQPTYSVIDALGRPGERPLEHGAWKTQPNHVERKDGSLLEYAPPEQVQSEIDQLLVHYADLQGRSDVHALTKAAWLHHRFVQIHPFADGNGRVARALTLLVLEQHRYAPLVVDRFHKGAYFDALDTANAGDLRPLISLFTKLECAALAHELDRPQLEVLPGNAGEVARTLARQIVAHRQRKQSERERILATRARALEGRLHAWFAAKQASLRSTFEQQGLADAQIEHLSATLPEDARRGWFRRQVIRSAQVAGHYAELGPFSGWSQLRLTVEGLQLRFVASLHGAGRDAGVVAVTTFGELSFRASSTAKPGEIGEPTFLETTKDAFCFTYEEPIEAVESRAFELEGLLEEGLTEALASLLKSVR